MAEEEDKEEDKEEALADRQYHEAQIAASVAVVATVGRCLHPELMATPGIETVDLRGHCISCGAVWRFRLKDILGQDAWLTTAEWDRVYDNTAKERAVVDAIGKLTRAKKIQQ